MLYMQGEAGISKTRKDLYEALVGPILGNNNNFDNIVELEQCSNLVSFKAVIGYYVKALLYHVQI